MNDQFKGDQHMAKKRLRSVGEAGGQIQTFNRAIGRRVHELMKQRGATIISLGKAVGISQAQVSRLQNGLQGFRSTTLFKIALALGVEPSELLP